LVDFEWDCQKAATNLKKHSVNFADITEVFYDELAITIQDSASNEERFITIGIDSLARVIVVVYTWREDRIRIISARKATAKERHKYESYP
jgi:uncharacterized DUF497 family protein